MGSVNPQTHHHFLIVTIAAQGQINPARQLARHLATTTSSRVTIATPLFSHRRLFPSSSHDSRDQVEEDDLISWAPYSDGYDEGFHPHTDNADDFMTKLKLIGTETLTKLARSLNTHGRPVTCVIYTVVSAWAADVALDLAVPSVVLWTQPASVFAIFYHYFHGCMDLITSNISNPDFILNLPGLPPLAIRDLPTVIADRSYIDAYEEIFEALEKERERSGGSVKPRVLMNTFHELEAGAIEAIEEFELISIGPMVELESTVAGSHNDLFDQDTVDYMEWLDSQKDNSVVYLSFGSLSRFGEAQMKEMLNGLEESRRPYLWVVRKDCRADVGKSERGMVVEWCNQVKVLSHKAVGCFVTHCGWNSTIECITCGVPAVMLPQWMEQATNARLMEEVWGVGVRVELKEDGVMEGKELKNCLDDVMGDGEKGVEIRGKVEMWKKKAREALGIHGLSDKGLAKFVTEI